MRGIDVLKQSSLALDYYTWLTYRTFSLNKVQKIPWESLHVQVGSDYSRTRDFKKKSLNAIQKIHGVWPELKIDYTEDSLIIKPCKPHVSPTVVQVISNKS
jgi:hypothetical protein